jgi:predicted peptidase
MHIPEDYDGSEPYALYVHCPGVEGFYSEGAGAHLVEDFVFVANDYVEDMIVITPQFDDWREVSAFMASALVDWALATFNIDESRLFLSGYSYGGETISYVMGLRPDLFKRVLQVSSQWDSDINALVETLPAIRISLGDNDEFYTVENAEETFNQIRELYEAAGISGDELDDLVKLDVFPDDDFEDPENQHDETPSLVIFDADSRAWLFNVG